ncbi:MAG: polysaccharide deacetylase family protein [Polyangiaceae bacterium]
MQVSVVMRSPRSLAAALPVALFTLAAALAGCAASAEDAELDDGDGVSEDAIVTERQLFGTDMPAKTISLTFDDGPGPRTKELADYLAAEGIKATFFINGKNVPGRQSAIDAIIGRGHLLANHTQNHVSMPSLSGNSLYNAVEDTDVTIRQVQPQGPFLLRAPYGAWNGRVARELNGTDMKKYVGSVFWDIGGELNAHAAADWDCWGKGVSVQRCGDLYVEEVGRRDHGIVLMHDVHSRTVDMVKNIVPTLKRQGYKFARLDDVPSIKRAVAGAAAGDASDGDCQSSTLGRSVPEGSCVQARSDRKWYLCNDDEWAGVASPEDARCRSKFPL